MADYLLTLLFLLGFIALVITGLIFVHNRDRKRDAKKIKEIMKS